MKTKTIKRIISKKINAWLDSIEDTNVRENCRRDFIVTGGSIASMLLQQDVNDFDIYFKRKETVEMVAKYYVNKINAIYKNNISNAEILVVDNECIPEKDYTDGTGDDLWSMFVKSLTRTKESRIKVYIPHIGYWNRQKDCIAGTTAPEEESYEPIYLTENAITLSDKIQLVFRFFGNVQEIHKNYDFVHATNYFHWDNGYKLVLLPEALTSLITKELVYIGSKYPVTSVIRSKKFLLRGFTVSAGTYLKMLWQVSELDLKDPVVLQDQLVGVDIAYFSLLIEALSNVDPSKLTYNYIAKVIDKIFSDDPYDEKN